MNDADRALLAELRRHLLQLHKLLIDWQRAQYERTHGRLQTMQLLNVIFNDPEFAWLRTLSGLIVRVDEALEAKPTDASDQPLRPEVAPGRPRRSSLDDAAAEEGTGPLMAQARKLVAPEPGPTYEQRYHAAMQEVPDVILAHRDLVTLLKLQRPASNA